MSVRSIRSAAIYGCLPDSTNLKGHEQNCDFRIFLKAGEMLVALCATDSPVDLDIAYSSAVEHGC